MKKTLAEILEATKNDYKDGIFGLDACKESIAFKLEINSKASLYTLLEEYVERANNDCFFNKTMVQACWQMINTPVKNGFEQYEEEQDNKKSYTVKDFNDNLVTDEDYLLIAEIDGNTIALARDYSSRGSSKGRYFTVKVNGNMICTRAREYEGIKKAIAYLNMQ